MNRSRALLGFAAAATAVGLLAGCSGGTPDAPEEGGTDSGGSGSDVVVVYTGAIGPMEVIAPAFEEATGIRVEIVGGSSSELAGRVRSEAGNPQGDVWFTSGDPIVKNPDLFELPDQTLLDRIEPRWFSASDPAPAVVMTTAIMYNSDLVSDAEVPTSYAELADEKWRGKIQMGDPAASSIAYSQVIGMYNAGGWELVEEVAKNLIISDNYAGPRAVSDGESPLGLYNEPSILELVVGGNPQVEMSHPKEGVIPVLTNLAMIKGTSRSDSAQAFIEWLLSDEGQAVVANDVVGLRPTTIGAPDAKDMVPISQLKLIDYPEGALTDKAEWLTRWEDIITNI